MMNKRGGKESMRQICGMYAEEKVAPNAGGTRKIEVRPGNTVDTGLKGNETLKWLGTYAQHNSQSIGAKKDRCWVAKTNRWKWKIIVTVYTRINDRMVEM